MILVMKNAQRILYPYTNTILIEKVIRATDFTKPNWNENVSELLT